MAYIHKVKILSFLYLFYFCSLTEPFFVKKTYFIKILSTTCSIYVKKVLLVKASLVSFL